MWIQCWRCKGDFDASRVDTEETVGLCLHCWNHTPTEDESLDEVRKRFLDTLRAKQEAKGGRYVWADSAKANIDFALGKDQTGIYEHRYVEHGTSVLEARIAASAAGIPVVVAVQKPREKPPGDTSKLLEEKLMEALTKFKGQPNTSVVRDAVEHACVRAILDMMPNKQADPPPIGLITNLVRQFMNEALDPTRPVVL